MMYNLNMAEEWLTTVEAAEIGGYHPDYIRKLLQAGKIKGRKFGPTWQVDKVSFSTYVKEMGEKGKRRGPKPK